MDKETIEGVRGQNAALNQWMRNTLCTPTIKKSLPTKHTKRQWKCKYKRVGDGKMECMVCGKRLGPGWEK